MGQTLLPEVQGRQALFDAYGLPQTGGRGAAQEADPLTIAHRNRTQCNTQSRPSNRQNRSTH